MHHYTSKTLKRFWSKISVKSDTECWEWQGKLSPYGKFRIGKKMLYSHRVTWEIVNGTIPQEMHVLHSCDNPACCNPNHLFLGSHLDNMRDKVTKNRQHIPKGEMNGFHKLSNQQIEDIRLRYAMRDILQKELAQQYGVSRQHISAIINRHTWK